ncbi:MAG: hypothetical protein ABI068_08245, partial [Ktedonobacterales bacterium]
MTTSQTINQQAVSATQWAAVTGRVPHDSDGAIQAAMTLIKRRQRGSREGYSWAGELSSSALATAMSIVALHLTGSERFQPQIAHGRAWLFATQQADGGWGDAISDTANVNATSLAYAALILTAPDTANANEQAHMARALARLERFGGWAVVGDPARCT